MLKMVKILELIHVSVLILFSSTESSALARSVSAFTELRWCDPSLLLSEVSISKVVVLSVTSYALLAHARYTLDENFLLQNSCWPGLAPWVLHRQCGKKGRVQRPAPRPQGMRLQYLILATNSFVAVLARDLPGVKKKGFRIVMSFLGHQWGDLNSRAICFLLLYCGALLLMNSGSRSLARTLNVGVCLCVKCFKRDFKSHH